MPAAAGVPVAVPVPAGMIALPGQRLQIDGRAGLLNMYADGPAGPPAVAATHPPLLLVHSINAAASAAEVRPLYEQARTSRPVYALDLPGYGLSERRPRAHTPRLMTDALHDALALIGSRHGNAPVDAVAVSLGCEYLARAAVEAPLRLRRLVLVSPSGFSGNKRRHGPEAQPLGPAWLPKLMKSSLGRAAFRFLRRPPVTRYFLERTWGSKDIDETLWRYDGITTRQPDAEWAPLDFLGAQLFSADINTLYERLEQPVLVVCGTRGDFTDYRGTTTIAQRSNWQVQVMPDTGALMYFERPAEFSRLLDDFLLPSDSQSSPGLRA